MMTLELLQKLLASTDGVNHHGVLTSTQLRNLIATRSEATFSKTVNNAVKARVLHRVKKGLFIYTTTKTKKLYLSIELVKACRPSAFIYISLESALSRWGVISQIPFTLTMMTSGRTGEIHTTEYGNYEFVHTARDIQKDIDAHNIIPYYNQADQIPLAKPWTALRDLKRVGRNMHLVDMEAYEEACEEALNMPV